MGAENVIHPFELGFCISADLDKTWNCGQIFSVSPKASAVPLDSSASGGTN